MHQNGPLIRPEKQPKTQSKRDSFESCSCNHGLTRERSGGWDWMKHEPPSRIRQSKDFMGQRMSDLRASLDWDFNTDTPLAATRRSKDYGEKTQSLKSSMSKGRSYSGSLDSDLGIWLIDVGHLESSSFFAITAFICWECNMRLEVALAEQCHLFKTSGNGLQCIWCIHQADIFMPSFNLNMHNHLHASCFENHLQHFPICP